MLVPIPNKYMCSRAMKDELDFDRMSETGYIERVLGVGTKTAEVSESDFPKVIPQ